MRQTLYYNFSDDDLKQAILEVVELQETGILKDGFVRRVAREFKQKVHPNSSELFLTLSERDCLEEGAFRWMNYQVLTK